MRIEQNFGFMKCLLKKKYLVERSVFLVSSLLNTKIIILFCLRKKLQKMQ